MKVLVLGGYGLIGEALIGRLLREAGSNHKLKGSRKSAKFVVPAAVLVLDDAIILRNGDGQTPIKDFEVDSRPEGLRFKIHPESGKGSWWVLVRTPEVEAALA